MIEVDAAELLDHLRRVAGDVSATSHVPACDVAEIVASADHVHIVKDGGRVIAHAALYRSDAAPHRASVSGAVERGYRMAGVGSAVLAGALQWADDEGIAWVDAHAWADNEAALALDRAHGFVEVGRLEDAYRRDGVSYTQVSMTRKAGVK